MANERHTRNDAGPRRPFADVHGTGIARICVGVVGAVVLLYLRRPDALQRPQFWAEDWVFFQQAYVGGLRALAVPVAGYLHTAPRLVGLLAQAVPFARAPLVFVCAALLFELTPALFLASRRMAALIPSAALRLGAAACYLLLPNTREVHATLTNVQWHLAVLALLVLIAPPPSTRKGRVFDTSVLLLCGLTGPFALLLMPIALAMARGRPGRARVSAAAVLGAGAAVQAGFLATGFFAHRPASPLGATPRLFFEILGGPFVFASLFGERLYWNHHADAFMRIAAPLLALLALALFANALVLGALELRLAVLFALLVVAASLASPTTSYTDPQWPLLRSSQGCRYWLIPEAALVAASLLAARSTLVAVRSAGLAVLLLLPIGIGLDFRHPEVDDLDFPRWARAFQEAPPGTILSIPIPPPPGWRMLIQKR